jgi:hypothetical protein
MDLGARGPRSLPASAADRCSREPVDEIAASVIGLGEHHHSQVQAGSTFRSPPRADTWMHVLRSEPQKTTGRPGQSYQPDQNRPVATPALDSLALALSPREREVIRRYPGRTRLS